MGTELIDDKEKLPILVKGNAMSDDSTNESEEGAQKLVNGDCNKLNDNGTSPTTPIIICGHCQKSVDFNSIKRTLKTSGLENKTCHECQSSNQPVILTNGAAAAAAESLTPLDEEENALWLCLKCGFQYCRQKNHYMEHFKKPRSDQHCLFVNTASFAVWCFICQQYVDCAKRKKILECIDYLKKDAKKVSTTQQFMKQQTVCNNKIENKTEMTVVAKPQVEDSNLKSKSLIFFETRLNNYLDNLPRVRGLSNLGNTCFFNAVLQCLAQTPYLSSVLKESSEAGEYFELPGGKLKLNDDDDEEILLPPITGNLLAWNPLTATLSETIDELKSGGGSVHNPRKLLNQLTNKWPQFGDGDQHDSHELLRHLLESVRNEDQRRYYTIILNVMGYSKKVDPQTVEGDEKKKIKFYGNQVTDRILMPEQVFRGFLVSTLMCQDCHHTSSRHENFLDISLPVSAEKPQPPIRRKSSPEPESMIALPMKNTEEKPYGAISRPKQKKKERKAKRGQKKWTADKNGNAEEVAGGDGDETPKARTDSNSLAMGDNDDNREDNETNDDKDDENDSSNESKSDADIEDNCVEEDNQDTSLNNRMMSLNIEDPDSGIRSPPSGEKRDDTPENPNKGDFEAAKNVVVEVGISETGANNFVQQYELKEDQNAVINAGANSKRSKTRQRTVSHSDWSTTIAPRYSCEDGECSVQSCLNNFTAIELMTGNNKVGCDACTERINGKNGKSVRTNATKQFLISSPPAVLILHLKRFQVGPRYMFRKLSRHVTFPFVLDIAPFCGTKIKNLPNVNRKQKKLLYSLYGIVEHSGGMHGGHYTAFVKVRPEMSKDDKRWKFIPQGSKAELDQNDEQRICIEEAMAKAREKAAENNDSDDSLSQSSETSSARDYSEEDGAVGGTFSSNRGAVDEEADKIVPPPGRWFYVSDSRVQETTEENVLKAQAYLLFYERIY